MAHHLGIVLEAATLLGGRKDIVFFTGDEVRASDGTVGKS